MATKRFAASSGGRVLELLLAVAESGRPLTVSELTELMGLPRSTVYRYVNVLRSHGLLWSIGGGRYAVGPRAMQLARSFEETVSLATVCRPVMERLAHETQETVALVVPVGERAVCIEAVESRQ
ncbi:MAG: IclR family transcriptional regulator, partial [Thermomicrobium sp.]